MPQIFRNVSHTSKFFMKYFFAQGFLGLFKVGVVGSIKINLVFKNTLLLLPNNSHKWQKKKQIGG